MHNRSAGLHAFDCITLKEKAGGPIGIAPAMMIGTCGRSFVDSNISPSGAESK